MKTETAATAALNTPAILEYGKTIFFSFFISNVTSVSMETMMLQQGKPDVSCVHDARMELERTDHCFIEVKPILQCWSIFMF